MTFYTTNNSGLSPPIPGASMRLRRMTSLVTQKDRKLNPGSNKINVLSQIVPTAVLCHPVEEERKPTDDTS
jgi:hypothetical protein